MAKRVGVLCLLLLSAAPVRGESAVRPEQFLPVNTVIYLRYDGIDAHRKAFDQSVTGELMRGELGDFFDYLTDLTRDTLGPSVLKERVLQGTPAKRLQPLRKGFHHAPDAVRWLTRSGFVAGVEFIGVFPVRAQATIIIPTGADEKNREAIHSGLTLLTLLNDADLTTREVSGRTVYQADPGEGAAFRIHWWQEGAQIVLTVGTEKPERTLELASGKRRSILEKPLFKEVEGFKDYESVARGFLDLENYAKALHLLPPPGDEVIDRLGFDNLKSATFHLGFEGRNMRTTLAVRAPGKRTGLLGMLTGGRAVDLANLPPLPSDAASFHVLNVDPGQVFDLLLGLAETTAALSSEEEGKEVQEMVQGLDERLGVSIRKDVFGQLGSQVVVYNSPMEGPFSLGLGLVIEVKDEAKLKATFDALLKSLPLVLGDAATVRKQACAGTDIFTYQMGGSNNFLLPSFAVHRGRLVVGPYPQSVRGYIRRADGKMAAWKPTPLVVEAIAAAKKSKANVIGLSVNDPRPPLRQLCPFGPILFTLLTNEAPGSFDVSRLPHVEALTEPLFPSVTVVTDDGTTLRIETRGSLGLPFLEPPGADGLFVAYALLRGL